MSHIKHRRSNGPEWKAYYHARARCLNRRDPAWKNYGGRGIEFRFASFEEFFRELGPRPKGLTLDRKDNDGHYEKGNVRWATRSEQAHNQRHNTKAQKRNHRNTGIRVTHFRWHLRRGIENPNCKLCRGVAL